MVRAAEVDRFPPPSVRPPSRRDSIVVLGRRPAAPNRREVSLHYAENGQRRHRTLTVGRPTSFEDVVVAVVDGASPLPKDADGWPRTLRDGARVAYHKLRAARSHLAAPLRAAVPMYDVRAVEPNNVAHLLLGILPLGLHAADVLGGEMTCVFRDVRGPHRELLDVLGVKATFTSRRLAGRMVRVRGTRGLSAHDLLDVFDVPNITFVPTIYDRFAFPSWGPDRIFIARRGQRSLLNQAEVERILGSRGYETVFMEDHPVVDQLGLASHARHVVAVHGAGMASLVMNRGLESVIELLPPNVYHDLYPICLSDRVKRYVLLMPEFDERIQHCDWPEILSHKSAPFAADLQALERALDEAGT